MAEEYILVRDIIHDHNTRMMNIKKYYPYFKLMEIDFSAFMGGKYQKLDMGYILMAVLRFFIEENNFNEKDVTYDEYEAFMKNIYRRDFDLTLSSDEEKSLSSYIFDKIRNEGKPFSYQYFDPSEKTKKIIRMRIIDSRIKNDVITYYITSDAIEFYLDTKEIKDESTISIAQVLLEKMIETKNFKGGTEVIKRINSEVNRLKMRKNEVLAILSEDVFEGIKAYEEFVNTGVKWFEEEQKLFEKNMELIHEALGRTAQNGEQISAMRDIYELETELKKAIMKHSELLNACTELQLMADKMISGAKLSRLRRSFDFADAMKTAMKKDNCALIKCLIEPLLKLNIKKTFDVTSVDMLLSLKAPKEEKGEIMSEDINEQTYVYDDEIEAERIKENFGRLILELFGYLNREGEFKLSQFNEYLKAVYGDEFLRNSDYYSLLVHMCQKKEYDISEILQKPDTFFEEHIADILKRENIEEYDNLHFKLEGKTEELDIYDVAQISDISFKKL